MNATTDTATPAPLSARLTIMAEQLQGMAEALDRRLGSDIEELENLGAALAIASTDAAKLEAPTLSLPHDPRSTHTGAVIEIRTVEDMLTVPEHRWPWMVKDLLLWLQHVRPMAEMIEGLKATLPAEFIEAMKLPPMDRMIWTDDGHHDAVVTVKVDGAPIMETRIHLDAMPGPAAPEPDQDTTTPTDREPDRDTDQHGNTWRNTDGEG